MNKKILGIKLSTILHFIICVAFALVAWFLIGYTTYKTAATPSNQPAEHEQSEDDGSSSVDNYLIYMPRC